MYFPQMLEDEYPDVYRFTCSVFPSAEDDVITSPYNALLSLAQLAEHADCVMPIENSSLQVNVPSMVPACSLVLGTHVGKLYSCVNLRNVFKCFLQIGWRLTGARSTQPECSLNVH
jgi:hypothetical protein